jgi:Ca2+-binding EF-hand superfamily protein
MGNEMGLPPSKMGITAMTLTTQNIEANEIAVILNELRNLSKAKSSESFDKSEVDAALNKVEKLEASDLELFSKLFTLYDVKGDGTVNYKDYMSGIAGCLLTGKMIEKLKIALSIFDENSTNLCLKGDVKRTLYSINNVASFFGDPVLTTGELDEVILQLFEAVPKVTGQFRAHEPVLEFLVLHPTIQAFAKGEGRARFGLMEPVL